MAKGKATTQKLEGSTRIGVEGVEDVVCECVNVIVASSRSIIIVGAVCTVARTFPS